MELAFLVMAPVSSPLSHALKGPALAQCSADIFSVSIFNKQEALLFCFIPRPCSVAPVTHPFLGDLQRKEAYFILRFQKFKSIDVVCSAPGREFRFAYVQQQERKASREVKGGQLSVSQPLAHKSKLFLCVHPVLLERQTFISLRPSLHSGTYASAWVLVVSNYNQTVAELKIP